MRTILFGAMGVMFIWVGMELNDSGYFIASGLFFICMNLNRFFKEEVKTDVGFIIDELLRIYGELIMKEMDKSAAKRVTEKHKEEDKNDMEDDRI